nr:unnamed protein product [Callosobruchus chinensis]
MKKTVKVKLYFFSFVSIYSFFLIIKISGLVYFFTKDGRFGCVRCGSSYKRKAHFARHLKYECGVERQFACNYCNVRFRHKRHLTVHMTSKRPPKFRCPNCPNVYLKKSTLSRHAKYECGKLPRFGCTLCNYRGYQKTHVERHLFTRHKFQTKNEIKRHVCEHYMD